MVNTPQEELSNENKQPILMELQDGEELGYNRGPYQIIIPGLNKGNYIGGILEIRINTSITQNKSDNGISGVKIELFGIFISISVIAMIKKHK